MKKIIASILCLVLLFSMASCANSAKDDAAETDATGAVKASYEDIIEKYDEFLNLKINKKRLPELVESSAEAIKVVRKIVDNCKTPLDMGYAKKDINGDGTDELILMRTTLDIAAIFTVKNGNAIPLLVSDPDLNSMIWLKEDGSIRMEQMIVKDQSVITERRYFVYHIKDGVLVPEVAISSDSNRSANLKTLSNTGDVSISYNEWRKLYAKYNLCPIDWDVREYTKSRVGLDMVRIFDAPDPERQTYVLSSSDENDLFSIIERSKKTFTFSVRVSQPNNTGYSDIHTARLVDGRYVFESDDNITGHFIKGSVELGDGCVWLNIEESSGVKFDRSSFLFDSIKEYED